MTIHAPRGALDILPEETAKWQYVEKTARDVCGRFGYREIRTPLFEATELFSRGIGEGTDIVEKEMYTFLDKADRSITLRPEGTASVVRAFLEHHMGQILPVKVYYMGPVFRYERPQAGRYRQHHQMGIEALGSQDPSLDGETMSLAVEFYRALGLSNLQIRMNSIGCKVCKPRYREALRAYAQARLETFCGECRRRLERNPLRILDCKVPACRELVREAPPNYSYLCGDCSAHFDGVKHYLEILSIPYALDPFIVRGLDYYTRTVYEVTSESLGAQNSLCGGGRYDDLAEELGGKPTPAVGFAAGLERVLMVMEKEKIPFPLNIHMDVFVASLGDEAGDMACRFLWDLRKAGLSADRDYTGRSLGNQLKQADRLGARCAVVLGESEIAEETATVKDMSTGQQIKVPFRELVAHLSSLQGSIIHH